MLTDCTAEIWFFLCFLQFKGEVVHEHLLSYESVLRERLIPKPNKPADKDEVNMCVYVWLQRLMWKFSSSVLFRAWKWSSSIKRGLASAGISASTAISAVVGRWMAEWCGGPQWKFTLLFLLHLLPLSQRHTYTHTRWTSTESSTILMKTQEITDGQNQNTSAGVVKLLTFVLTRMCDVSE